MSENASPRKVSRSIQVRAHPGQVLAAFLHVQKIRQWWGIGGGLVEARKGGLWTLVWQGPSGEYKYVVSGVIKSCTLKSACASSRWFTSTPSAPSSVLCA